MQEITFSSYVARRHNQVYLWAGLFISTLSWWIFKQFYTSPNIIWDSYFYTDAAVTNADVNNWPIGYSKFIRFIGWFSHDVNVLLTVQYFILVFCFMYFFFTIRYFFYLGTWASNILFVFLLLNPIFLFISNLILSDTLFTGLTLVWLCQLLWIVFHPRPYMIATHALLIFCLFTIRYYALYYPFAAIIFFVLSKQPVVYKIGGIVLQFALIGWFVTFTTNKMETEVGVKQFSPFGGWKLASNALYMYDHVTPDKKDSVPAQFKEIDQRVRRYFDSPHEKISLLDIDATWGSFYMFIYPPSPLIEQQLVKFQKDTITTEFRKFSSMGPLYESYGNYLIRKYPAAFVRYIVLPNTILYFQPHPEVFADSINPFHLRADLGQKTMQWFGISNITISSKYIKARDQILSPYSTINKIIHIVFLGSVFGFFFLKGHKRIWKPVLIAVIALLGYWLCNFGFTILSAGSLLRYQLFIIIVEFTFSLFFLEYIVRSEDKNYPLLHQPSKI